MPRDEYKNLRVGNRYNDEKEESTLAVSYIDRGCQGRHPEKEGSQLSGVRGEEKGKFTTPPSFFQPCQGCGRRMQQPFLSAFVYTENRKVSGQLVLGIGSDTQCPS